MNTDYPVEHQGETDSCADDRPLIATPCADCHDALETGGPRWEDLPPRDLAFLYTTGLVRLTAAASWLGVSPASLRRHVHEGRCSGRKFDGDWYVGRGTVERWHLRRQFHLRG
jgi:hypothetical protein